MENPEEKKVGTIAHIDNNIGLLGSSRGNALRYSRGLGSSRSALLVSAMMAAVGPAAIDACVDKATKSVKRHRRLHAFPKEYVDKFENLPKNKMGELSLEDLTRGLKMEHRITVSSIFREVVLENEMETNVFVSWTNQYLAQYVVAACRLHLTDMDDMKSRFVENLFERAKEPYTKNLISQLETIRDSISYLAFSSVIRVINDKTVPTTYPMTRTGAQMLEEYSKLHVRWLALREKFKRAK